MALEHLYNSEFSNIVLNVSTNGRCALIKEIDTVHSHDIANSIRHLQSMFKKIMINIAYSDAASFNEFRALGFTVLKSDFRTKTNKLVLVTLRKKVCVY
jgi:hypothetical protein